MASTQDVCKGVFESVQDCLAVGVVDLNTGMRMGVHHTIPTFAQAYLDAVAAAVDMFRGKTVRRVEEMLSERRGTEVKDSSRSSSSRPRRSSTSRGPSGTRRPSS